MTKFFFLPTSDLQSGAVERLPIPLKAESKQRAIEEAQTKGRSGIITEVVAEVR